MNVDNIGRKLGFICVCNYEIHSYVLLFCFDDNVET